MKLKEYLALNAIKQNKFAEIVGENASCINKICLGIRVPRPHLMLKIFLATNGAVTPNDFILPDEGLSGGRGFSPASSVAVSQRGITC